MGTIAFSKTRKAKKNSCSLAAHVLAMADDAYLVGHPKWPEIVKDARFIEEAFLRQDTRALPALQAAVAVLDSFLNGPGEDSEEVDKALTMVRSAILVLTR